MQGVVPARFRHDKQLVSHDTHSAEYNYKYTFSVEIVPICKEDLICLPPKLSQAQGNIGPLVLCTKVRLQHHSFSSSKSWGSHFDIPFTMSSMW